jgi:parallel beta-helix repeat protein
LPQPVQATFSGPQSTPPPIGNWVINTPNNIVVNETITLNGNLTIQNGGSLTFKNVTLLMNCPTNGSYYIVVEAGGEFYIYDYDNNTATTSDRSVITSSVADGHHRFCFQVNKSAKFQMKNSELHECGVQLPSTLLPIDYTGLTIYANDTIFENNLISNNFRGLMFTSSSNNTISNCTIKNNVYQLQLFESSNNNTIYNCDLSNGTYSGISIDSSSNNILKNCNFYFNEQGGVCISKSDHIDVINCNISSNNAWGVWLWGGNFYINISNCNITNNYFGFDIYQNTGGKISNNSILGNLKNAINLRFPQYINAQYNYFGTSNPLQIDELIDGIVDYSNFLTFRPSRVLYVNGTTSWTDINKNIDDGLIVNGALTIDNVNLIFTNAHGQNFIQINNNLTVLNSHLDSNLGFYTLLYTNISKGSISDSIFRNYRGVRIESNIKINNSEFNHSVYGIFLENYNKISNCLLLHHKLQSITSEGLNNNISFCNLSTSYGLNPLGISVSKPLIDIFECNIERMYRGIQMYKDGNGTITNCTFSNNSYGIASYTSNAFTNINNCRFSDNNRGIYLSSSLGFNITNCRFNWNYYGIELSQSSNNNITENTFISSTSRAVYFHLSSDFNYVYHNNFYSNNIHGSDNEYNNRWNDSYPSGGNYWDDYSGVDNKRGPKQDILGSDGIGDTWYTNINSPNDVKDFYPLMKPYQPNNPPKVLNLNTSHSSVYRTNSILVYANAQDEATDEDKLKPYFEFNTTTTLWRNDSLSSLQYKNNRWEVMFTPNASAELGSYNFRVRFMDYTFLNSSWLYFNDAVKVLNNLPYVQDLTLNQSTSVANNEVLVWVNGADVEDAEDELVPILEYRDPGELAWNTTYLSAPTFATDLWEFKFVLPHGEPYGLYDFRSRVNDTDGNLSQWRYSNDSLLVYNSHPHIIEVNLSEASVFRTNPVFIEIEVVDHETPTSDLEVYLQYHFEGAWENLTVEFLNDTWEAWFIPGKESPLGDLDLRVMAVDNESAVHGWVYLNDSIEVLNNPPVISDDLDNISVGINPYYTFLATYESDIEDDSVDLIWSVDDTLEYDYLESVEIVYESDDKLKIASKLNVTGSEDITLTLTDKDGGIDTKIDITVNVNSLITNETPKVTLLTPVDKTIVNTLTPEFTWQLDYPGTDIISYNFYIEDNPVLLDPIPIATTSYTPDIPLEDGTTYYWKVVPLGGICLSEQFSFTIDLNLNPIYLVNLSTVSRDIMLNQGDSIDIELTVKNEGNVKDAYELEVTSTGLQPHLTLENNNIQLVPAGTASVKLGISIPLDFEVKLYTVKVTTTSITEYTATDELEIFIEVMSGDYFPIYKVEITATPGVIVTSPGNTETLTLNISNAGNVEDTYSIYFESFDFDDKDITFSTTSLFLNDGEVDQVTVTIAVPEDALAGDYPVKFYAESAEDSDNVRVTLKVQEESEPDGDGDDEDDMSLYIGIGIVIIIIVIVAILLFLFVLRKKPAEGKPEVQENVPQEPALSQAPAGQFPPPQPQMMLPQYYMQTGEQPKVKNGDNVEE